MNIKHLIKFCEWGMAFICVLSGLMLMFRIGIVWAYVLFAIGHLGWLLLSWLYLRVTPLIFQNFVFLSIDLIGIYRYFYLFSVTI